MKIGEEEQVASLTNSDTATLLEVLVTAQQLEILDAGEGDEPVSLGFAVLLLVLVPVLNRMLRDVD